MEEISLKAELTDEEMRSIFGMRDAYIKKVESSMDVRVVSRNGYLYVYGSKDNAEKAMSVIMDLKDYSGKVENIEEQSVDYAIEEAADNNGDSFGLHLSYRCRQTCFSQDTRSENLCRFNKG